MFRLDVNEEAVVEQSQLLERLLSTNPKTQKALQELIRQVILEARAQVVGSISFDNGDPRQARRAVRTAVYKKILGANINIYNSRKAHGRTSYEPPRKGSTGRGGNRRSRNMNTQRIMSYDANDRGFILRFVNSGTNGRNIQFTTNDRRHVDKWNAHPNTGNRGQITPRNFFRPVGERALVQATDHLANLIDTELEKMLNKK